VCYGRVCDVGKRERASERNSVESRKPSDIGGRSPKPALVGGAGRGGARTPTHPFSGASDKSAAIEITLP